MANKMIIDASHPEETRVVVLRGNRVEEFDFESASKRPLRGNIYLAKVTRVEPSLQAAFVDYGGNRHGFLAFSEIHPDYYQIPVADRQALLEEEALSQREEDEEASGERRSRRHRRPRRPEVEARVEEVETLSERAPADDLGSDELAPSPSSADSEGNSDETKAVGPDLSLEAVSGETSADAAPSGETAERSGADSPLETPKPSEPDEAEAGGRSVQAPMGAETRGESAEAARAADEIEREENPHEDDDQEVTTLEDGSEERIAPSRKPQVEDEGEPVEQVGGDAMRSSEPSSSVVTS